MIYRVSLLSYDVIPLNGPEAGWYKHKYHCLVKDNMWDQEVALDCVAAFDTALTTTCRVAAICEAYNYRKLSPVPMLWEYYKSARLTGHQTNMGSIISSIKLDQRFLTDVPVIDYNKYYPCLARLIDRKLFSSRETMQDYW